MMCSIFSCTCWHCLSSLEKGLFSSFAGSEIGYFSFCCKSSLHIIETPYPYQIFDLQIFAHILWVIFSLSSWCILKHKVFNYDKSKFSSIVTCSVVVFDKKPLPNQDHKNSLTCFLLKIYSFSFYLYMYDQFSINFCVWFGDFILSYVDSYLSQYCLLKRFFSLH